MQSNSNTRASISSENFLMDPQRPRGTKFSERFKCEHVLFIAFFIVIIAMLGSILHKQTELDKKIEKEDLRIDEIQSTYY